MNILDDTDKIKKIDKSDVYGSIAQLSNQCVHAFGDTENLKVPESYSSVNKIVMCGMGGSGLAARVIKSVYADELKFPIELVNDYNLPSWTDKNTLLIASSFSGTTEEVVSCIKQAIEKGIKWMAIGSGGTLIDLAEKHKVPFYRIVPTYNPSKQPRLAIGYSIVGQLILAEKVGLISFSKEDLENICKVMEKVVKNNKKEVALKTNPAKRLSKRLKGKNIAFIGAGHMTGAIHCIKNQMNENAKTFAVRFDIPELNHHLMEGLEFPREDEKLLHFIFIDSELYPERIRKRLLITRDVVEKIGITTTSWKPKSESKLQQAFEFIQYGGLVNFYLSVINNTDPAPIPWVDYFKKRLGQPLGQWK